MIDYLTIGPTPYDEDCSQVGAEDYRLRTQYESKAFIDQLTRQLPPPKGCRFRVKAFAHDFGTYHEVVAEYDTDSEEAIQWAFDAESDTPANWDEQATAYLATIGDGLLID